MHVIPFTVLQGNFAVTQHLSAHTRAKGKQRQRQLTIVTEHKVVTTFPRLEREESRRARGQAELAFFNFRIIQALRDTWSRLQRTQTPTPERLGGGGEAALFQCRVRNV